MACISLSLLGCARVVIAPPPTPPAPVVAAAVPPVEPEPAPPQQRIAAEQPAPVFLDPERHARLAAAFPAIEAYLQQAFADEQFVALAAGIVVDGELAWFHGYGHRDRERGLPVEKDTVFGIGSITKTFTALAALRLRDEGRLDIDRPAATYLPALDTIVYPSADSPRLTIRHILTHTSGLPRNGHFHHTQDDLATRAAILASLDGFALEHPPGERHLYSNLAFQLLGFVVGDLTGGDHRAYIRDTILAPLGMDATVWDPGHVPEDRLALPYQRKGGHVEVRPHWRYGDADAAGGLFSSVEDLARYAAYHLAAWPARHEPDPGPLRRATLREAHTMSALISYRTETVPDAPARGRLNGIGLGFVIQGNCRHDHIVMHSGHTSTYRASMQMLPSRGVAVILLTNIGAGDGLALPRHGMNVLDMLDDTGALEPRRHAPAPALLAGATGFGALVGDWDEAAYARLFSARLRDARPADRTAALLAKWRAIVGACRDPRATALESPHKGTVELTCDHGGLRIDLQVDPDSAELVNFNIRGATGLAPDREYVRVAERVLRLRARWNEREFRDLFADDDDAGEVRRTFADSAARRGRCRLGAPRLVGPRGASYVVNCERGSPNLTFKLSDTTPAKITWMELHEERKGPCE